jgi:hypothetical protein
MAPRPISSSDKPLLINGVFFGGPERMTKSVTKSQNSCDQMQKCRGEGAKKSRKFSGRGDRIRTCDIYVPNVALYQSELHPGCGNPVAGSEAR